MRRYYLFKSETGRIDWSRRSTALGPKGRAWRDGDTDLGYWVNNFGAGCRVSPRDEILETTEVESEDALDWMKTSWVSAMASRAKDWRGNKLYEGWLSPEGEFWGCQWQEHDTLAFYVLKKQVRDLEREGWGRVIEYSGGILCSVMGKENYDGDLTEAQAKFLLELEELYQAWYPGRARKNP